MRDLDEGPAVRGGSAKAEPVRAIAMDASSLAGLDGEGVLQVRRTPDGRVAEAIGTWRPAREDARSAVTLERLVAQARPVPFDGLLEDPAGRGEKRFAGHVRLLRIARYEWNEAPHGRSDVRTLVRFAPVDPALAIEASHRAHGLASNHAGVPGSEGSVRATLPPLSAPLPGTLAAGAARLEGIAGRFWSLDDGAAALWMSTPAESGMAWNELVAAVTRLPHTKLHVVVGGPEEALPSRPRRFAGARGSSGSAIGMGSSAAAAQATSWNLNDAGKTWLADLASVGSTPDRLQVGVRLRACLMKDGPDASRLDTLRAEPPSREPALAGAGVTGPR